MLYSKRHIRIKSQHDQKVLPSKTETVMVSWRIKQVKNYKLIIVSSNFSTFCKNTQAREKPGMSRNCQLKNRSAYVIIESWNEKKKKRWCATTLTSHYFEGFLFLFVRKQNQKKLKMFFFANKNITERVYFVFF